MDGKAPFFLSSSPCVGFGFKGDVFSDKCLLVWRLGEEKLAAEAEKGLQFILSAEVVVQTRCDGCHQEPGWVMWWVGCDTVDVA